MSQFFASGGHSIGASASASVLPMNIQDWFPLGLTGLISKIIFSIVGLFKSWFKQIPKMTFDYCLLSFFQSRQSVLSLPQYPPHPTMTFCKKTQVSYPKEWMSPMLDLSASFLVESCSPSHCALWLPWRDVSTRGFVTLRFFPPTFSARILHRWFVYITQQHIRKFTMSGYLISGVQMYVIRIIFLKTIPNRKFERIAENLVLGMETSTARFFPCLFYLFFLFIAVSACSVVSNSLWSHVL